MVVLLPLLLTISSAPAASHDEERTMATCKTISGALLRKRSCKASPTYPWKTRSAEERRNVNSASTGIARKTPRAISKALRFKLWLAVALRFIADAAGAGRASISLTVRATAAG